MNYFKCITLLILTLGATSPLFSGPRPKSDYKIQPVYIEKIDDNNFEQLLTIHPILVVDFSADWCQPCRRFHPIFEKVAQDLFGTASFGEINIDYAPVTSGNYNINSVPTIIIFKNGKEVARRSGGSDAKSLKDFILSAI